MTKSATVYIGLGSNLGEPSQQIQAALDALSELDQCSALTCAPWYRSQAIGPKGQPDYINTVACLNTLLPPLVLLRQLQAIEDKQGRQRSIRWGARTLDLDLLLYDNVLIDAHELQLPHPEMQHRNFVLLPLFDLAPNLILPDGNTLKALVKNCKQQGIERLQ